MAAFLAVRTAKLASDSEPFFSSTSQRQTEAVDLWELGFMFAISEISPEIGTIEAYQVTWASRGSEQVKTPIKMVNCDELLAGGSHEGQSNNSAFGIS